ncbi:MAG: hypothetical protein A2Y33_10510 [Spirochaetes bacterium GWF1_51_8]|nr:MAG: hypothetical protein A2Y33_10510 [Spirochaetes bacterium GWF1_51_8]
MRLKDLHENDINKLADEIGKLLLFKHMTIGEKRQFIGYAQQIDFDKGDAVITEGQVEPYLYIVLKGSFQVMKKREGKDVYISTLGEGDLFGEASIFVKLPRTADIIAGDTPSALRIDRRNLLNFLFSHSESGMKFLMIMIYGLLEKLHQANTDLSFDRKSFISQENVDQLLADIGNK